VSASAGSNAEVAQEKFGPFARADAPKEAPANPAELLVIQGDGLRVRERVHAADTSAADAADRPSEASDELPEADRAKGWREAKVVIAISDAGHGLPKMWAEVFGDVIVVWIADFHHVSSRLAECANAVAEPAAAARLFHRWKGLLYEGKLTKLLRELVRWAGKFAPRPGAASDLAEKTPGRVLWEHVLYVERYREHMRCDEYRAKGWPMASGHVEAFAKHVGGRMKAASKRWKPVEGSEAMVNLLADQASQDGRCQRRWPADPVPLEKLGTT
jgi:hypothetical protein